VHDIDRSGSGKYGNGSGWRDGQSHTGALVAK